jgi:hypothetical protein
MWLFRKKRISRAQLRLFADFISKEGLRAMEESANEFPPLEKEQIGYVVFQVRDDTPEEIPRRLADAVEIAVGCGAWSRS